MNQRNFICGSEWLYFKIYSGPKTIENILINEIFSKLEWMIKEQVIDYFFFIRYVDPEYHIRLRLHFKHPNSVGMVLCCINEILSEYVINHIISKVIIDTYNREIERYRDKYIDRIERVFFYDSRFIIKYLIDHREQEDEKWLVAVKYIDLLLDSCSFSLTDKIDFCDLISSSYSDEIYSNNKHTRKQINEKYRLHTKILMSTLSIDGYNCYPWISDLTKYMENILFFTSEIKDDLISEKYDVLSSMIHMHINRLFRTKQRVSECVIYHLLLKYYRSKNSREILNIRI